MNTDWHQTQNSEYLQLALERLAEPRLKWVDQFWSIILTKRISWHDSNEDVEDCLSVNDFGCNVGHFYRGCSELQIPCSYSGYDISEIYLNIAKKHFGKSADFSLMDISLEENRNHFKVADVSVISATLEHLQDYGAALKNMISNTRKMILIRTFLGEQTLEDFCVTKGAKKSCLIRQFQLSDIQKFVPSALTLKTLPDFATDGEFKFVCNQDSILRKQHILLLEKINE